MSSTTSSAWQLTLLASAALGAGAPGFAQQPAASRGGGAEVLADNLGQSALGRLPYRMNCGNCHGRNLTEGERGPPLKSAEFSAKWQDHAALLNYIRTTMPPGAAGTLSAEVYAQITAYVLRNNEPPRPPDAIDLAAEAERKARLAAVTSVTDAMLTNPPAADWLIWRGDYRQLGFSALAQIDRSNVASLQQSWAWNLLPGQNQMTPLVHDGVMFLTSSSEVVALDAGAGDLLWRYTRPLPADLEGGRSIRGPRAIAIHQDKLFVTTVDKHLIALDVRTGAVVWDIAVIKEKNDVIMSGALLAVRGKIVLGTSGGQIAPGGNFILGVDTATGKEVWRFNTVARPGEPGGDSWNGVPVEQRFGGGVWTGASYDPLRNLLLVGVAQTYTTGTLLRRPAKAGHTSDGLYMDSTLALDPDTGKLVWFYQHLNRDVWDADWAFERTLATLNIDGKPRDVVLTAGKPGIFDVLDRSSGRYLFSRDPGLQTLISAIEPRSGRKMINPAAQPEWGKTKLICAFHRNWPTTAFNPNSRVLYAPLSEGCTNFSWIPRGPDEVARGGTDILYEGVPRPGSDGMRGRLQAIDMDTGRTVWTRRERAGSASSLLATAGGLLFSGTSDRYFRAHDEANGEVLWETRLNATPRSSPVTYSVRGVQHVAVVAGPGGGDSASSSLTVVSFRLPAARKAN